MKRINEEIKSLVLEIQGLVIETPKINMNYNAEIYSLSIYSFGENGKYQYHKRLYIDGAITNEKAVIAELKQIINDLKEIRKNGYSSKSKCAS
jgi:hypothetical protein